MVVLKFFCTYLAPSRLRSSSSEEAEASVSSESVVDVSSCCMPGCKFMCRCPAAAGMWCAAVASPGVGTLSWEPLAADCAGMDVLYLCRYLQNQDVGICVVAGLQQACGWLQCLVLVSVHGVWCGLLSTV